MEEFKKSGDHAKSSLTRWYSTKIGEIMDFYLDKGILIDGFATIYDALNESIYQSKLVPPCILIREEKEMAKCPVGGLIATRGYPCFEDRDFVLNTDFDQNGIRIVTRLTIPPTQVEKCRAVYLNPLNGSATVDEKKIVFMRGTFFKLNKITSYNCAEGVTIIQDVTYGGVNNATPPIVQRNFLTKKVMVLSNLLNSITGQFLGIVPELDLSPKSLSTLPLVLSNPENSQAYWQLFIKAPFFDIAMYDRPFLDMILYLKGDLTLKDKKTRYETIVPKGGEFPIDLWRYHFYQGDKKIELFPMLFNWEASKKEYSYRPPLEYDPEMMGEDSSMNPSSERS